MLVKVALAPIQAAATVYGTAVDVVKLTITFAADLSKAGTDLVSGVVSALDIFR